MFSGGLGKPWLSHSQYSRWSCVHTWQVRRVYERESTVNSKGGCWASWYPGASLASVSVQLAPLPARVPTWAAFSSVARRSGLNLEASSSSHRRGWCPEKPKASGSYFVSLLCESQPSFLAFQTVSSCLHHYSSPFNVKELSVKED